MLGLKFAVIFYQLIEGDGTVAVQIHTGIQYMVVESAARNPPRYLRGYDRGSCKFV